MILIDQADLPSHRMMLVGEAQTERRGGAGEQGVSQPESWIELSEPLAITLNKEPLEKDAELAGFLEAERGKFRYDYVRLGCSFGPRSPERFEKAWLKVLLKPKDAQVAVPPVSWSIFPTELHDDVECSSNAKIGAKVKILEAGIGADSKFSKKLYSLQGFKEGGPTPFWEMRSTTLASLEGMLRFHMIVRSLAESGTVAEVRLEAVISNRVFVAFRQSRAFDQTPSQSFHLPPD